MIMRATAARVLGAILLLAAPSALAHGAPKKAAPKADAPSEWYMRPEVLAVGATALISIAPMAVLPLLPEATGAGMTSQPLLLCFAAGGMLGDVFLHTLPETLGGGHDHDDDEHAHEHDDHADHKHEHDHGHDDDDHDDHDHHEHEHDHHDHKHDDHKHEHDGHGHSHSLADSLNGLTVLGGFIAFFFLEKAMRHSRAGHGHGHDHGHNHSPAARASPAPRRSTSPAKASPAKASGGVRKRGGAAASPAKSPARAPAPKTPTAAAAAASERLVAGYLNLAADAAHNFTDGLMLGANFLSGPRQGLSATLAILFHEVPHEVGDVAILMQAGFSKWAAIRAQLSTALGALLGTLVGLAAGRTNSALLQCFTAGGFIYVATVDVLPSLLRECSPKQSALELLAMGAGIYLMYLVLVLEAYLE